MIGNIPEVNFCCQRHLMHDFPLFDFQIMDKGNITISTFNFRPKRTDHDKVLTCRAENTEVANSALEDSWRLAVYCK